MVLSIWYAKDIICESIKLCAHNQIGTELIDMQDFTICCQDGWDALDQSVRFLTYKMARNTQLYDKERNS